MSQTSGRTRWIYTVLIASALGCTRPTDGPSTSHVEARSRQALTTANGYAENGLWANGLWANGLWANGLWANGLWANGLWANGLWANGLWANGLWANGLWANGLSGEAAIPGDTLRNSEYARALLQYIYACAMPPVTYDTAIDPGAGACTPGGDATAECGAGYACSPAGACVVPLTGAIGVGINADGSSWGESGQCDESCQRWVSSCVLARTNAYGVHVQISMRAPAVAPPGREAQFARIQAALATTPDEVSEYSLREGAYYGNLFATTPVNPAPSPGYSGPTDGPIANTPVFYACAGPASSIPDLTKRFCSSQGDATVISVPGVCVTGTTSSGATEAGTCAGLDAAQSLHDCYTTASPAPRPACSTPNDPTCFQEVITVYLKMPLAVCANDICETGESDVTCPDDCHPGSWAHSYDKPLSEQNFGAGSTTVTGFSAADQTIVMAGLALKPVDFGGGDLIGDAGLGLVKFAADGTYLWGRKQASALSPSVTHAVAVGADGSIVVSGLVNDPSGAPRIWLGRYDSAGALAAGWPITINGEPGVTNGTRLAIDSQGNILVSAAAPMTPSPSNYQYGAAYVYKVSAEGRLAWTASLGLSYAGYANPIAVDAKGDVLVAIKSPDGNFLPTFVRVLKLSGGNGGVLWDSRVTNARAGAAADDGMFCALTVDGAGDVYVLNAAINGALDSGLQKFSSMDGLRLFVHPMSLYHPSAVCYSGHDFLSMGPDGSVVAGMVFGGFFRTVADLGAGEFESFSTADVAVAAYAPDTTLAPGQSRFRWAKHLPMILQSQFSGMGVDSAGRVVVTGSYSGSMLVDGHLLINSIPELTGNANVYLASFGGPSLSDKTPPTIGVAIDPNDGTINTVPSHIYTPATSGRGAVVWYLAPTAIDDGHAGTSVACSPRPNSLFPLGTTTVTCTATDPLGNRSKASFPVTVVDAYGPVFAPVSDPPAVRAPGAAGASVTFPTPTATDQLDGPRPVQCAPASGSVFPVGTTTVTCASSDLANNTSRTTFTVTVTPPPFGTACASSADCAAGSCVDGVCCNTTAASCGQCQACNVPGSVGTCAPTSGGSCNDGNACTRGDVCRAGTCVPGAPLVCNDGNVCTTDSCHPTSGCVYRPGNAGVVCRAAANVCDTAETCTGQSAVCPAATDSRAPRLNPGVDQTVVGTCSSGPVAITAPTLANPSCEAGTTVSCTPVPGNSYGVHPVKCTARDGAGNVSPAVTFKVTVLRPLSVLVQPPLNGNGATNVARRNSTVPHKVVLHSCGTNVTDSAAVTVKLGVKYFRGNGTPGTPVAIGCDGVGDSQCVMKREGRFYRYDLSTKGLQVTSPGASYYEETVTVTYRSSSTVVAGADTFRLELE